MKSNTQSVTLSCHRQRAFEFLSRPENLPKWATGFCRAIRKEGEHWIAETPQGDITVRFVTEPEHGVVDYHLSPAPPQESSELVARSRVVPNGEGVEYIFTQFQPPGMLAGAFEDQIRTLREELQRLREILAD